MRSVILQSVWARLSVASRVAASLVLLCSCSRTVRPEAEVEPLASPSLATSEHAAAADSSTPSALSTSGASAAPQAGAAVASASAPQTGRGVAVVELFTSEGCSSCPPADRVLSQVAARAKAGSLPIYTLSFHVDYWNYLGWRDRFSNSSYSERQRGYATINPSGSTYTPQAVINGEAECVGSDASQIDALITIALQRKPRTLIELQARRVDGGVEVSYRVSGDTAGRVLNLALVEPHAESAVKSGENSGERLAHVNVVRGFESHPLSAGSAGSWSFKPSADFAARRVGVVAYAEQATQRDISGAVALELD